MSHLIKIYAVCKFSYFCLVFKELIKENVLDVAQNMSDIKLNYTVLNVEVLR